MKKIKYLLFLLFLLPFIYFTEVNANEGNVEGDNDENQVEEVIPDEEVPGDSSNKAGDGLTGLMTCSLQSPEPSASNNFRSHRGKQDSE